MRVCSLGLAALAALATGAFLAAAPVFPAVLCGKLGCIGGVTEPTGTF